MNDAAYVDYGPQITPVTSSPLWAAAPAGLEQYWGWNDPRWGAWGETPEAMKYRGPWEQVLKSMGFQGSKPDAETARVVNDPSGIYKLDEQTGQLGFSPDAKAFIDRLRSAGYDLRQKHPDRRTFNTYYGLVTPSGEVQDIKIEGSDLGDMIMPLIKTWGAGLGLASLGAGINSLLGGAGAGAGAGAGSALGIAEAMAPGVLAPATAAEMAGVNALLGGGTGALTAADFANLSPDVLGKTVPIPQYEVASFPPLGDGTVTNVLATGVPGAEAAALPQAVTPAEAIAPAVPGRTPLPPISEPLTPLQPFPTTAGGAVTPPSFEFGTLADFPASAAGTATSIPAGVMEGMVPGGLTGAGIPVTAAEIAATNSLLAGLGAGAGVGTLAGGGGGTAAPAAAASAIPAGSVMEGMVPGGLEAAGISATPAELMATGAVVAGAGAGGGSILDKAIDLIKSPAGGALLSGVGSVVGGITQANAAEAAANQQAEAARNALQLQREMFEYQKGLLEPYRTAGTAALERLSGAMGLGGQAQQQKMLEMDPGYGFRLGEGLKALERMQAARGSMLSGGAMKAGQRYAQDYASGEYSNAYNRLANIAGLGQTAGTQLGGAAQQFGQTAGNVMGQEANALAAGRIGRGSAYGNAIQGGLNAYSNYLNQQQQNQLFRDIFGRTAIGG